MDALEIIRAAAVQIAPDLASPAPSKRLDAIPEAAGRGAELIVFPEGTRGDSDTVGTFKKGVKYDAEGTGLGWATSATILAKDVDQPNTCKMKRPSAS